MDKQLQDKISDLNIGIAALSRRFTDMQDGKPVDFEVVNTTMIRLFTDIAELLEEITEVL